MHQGNYLPATTNNTPLPRSFKNELRSQNWDNVTRNNDFNTAWDGFKTISTNIINKHAPLVERTVRGKDCPWLTREIKQKMYERDYQLRKAKRTKNPEDCTAVIAED